MDILGLILALIFGVVFALWRAFYSPDGNEETSPADRPGEIPAAVVEWETYARQAAQNYQIPHEIIMAQIWQESTGNPEARGSNGEYGLMQLKPIAIEDLRRNGYGNFDGWQRVPSVNIQAGTAYLDLQRKRSGQLFLEDDFRDYASALESYNEGYAMAKRDLGPDEYDTEIRAKASVFGYAN